MDKRLLNVNSYVSVTSQIIFGLQECSAERPFQCVEKDLDIINRDSGNSVLDWIKRYYEIVVLNPEDENTIGIGLRGPGNIDYRSAAVTGTFVNDQSISQLRLYGTAESNELASKLAFDYGLKEAKCKVSWTFSEHDTAMVMPLQDDKMPIDAMYPYIHGGIEDYYDRYLQSSASVLICIGPPGVGKTTFIRGLLKRASASASVSYDQNILDSDSFFASYMSSGNRFMVIEDADTLLSPRENGNTSMQRFLNAGDGLVTPTGRKLVFTTNLPNRSKIDPALTRSGRCFDILQFRRLTLAESITLAKAMSIDIDSIVQAGLVSDMTLAEVINSRRDKG